MNNYLSHSIDRKLIALALGSMLLILLLSSTAFFVQQYRATTHQSQQALQTLTAVLGYQVAPTLLFDDPDSAQRDLGALRSQPSIISAVLCDASNQPFASYQRSPDDALPGCISDPNNRTEPRQSFWPLARAQSIYPVIIDGEQVGHIIVWDDNSQAKTTLLNHALISTAIVLFALMLAILFAALLPRMITQPLRNLAQTMSLISREGNYQLRAQKIQENEIGQLVDAFNRMLEDLEQRDNSLKLYGQHLESLVYLKTKDLEAARKHAVAANETKSHFLAQVSHEIRNPLTAIVGLSELLADTPLTPEQAQYVQQQKRSVDLLLGLLDDLLEFSQIEAGKVSLRAAACSIAAIGEDIETQLRHQAADKNLDFTVIGFDTIADTIIADKTKISQILLNLAGNAIKFTDRGYVSVQAKILEDESDHLRIALIVQDSGTGISKADKERIFEPFKQLPGSGQGLSKKGVGLGLAITRELVELMRGDLTLASTPGRGSEFTVTLKLQKQKTSKNLHSPKHYIADNSRQRVLLVEDDPIIREIHSRYVKNLGYRCHSVTNVAQASRELETGSYDLVLLDIQLGDGDGVELTRSLRKKFALKNLPVLGLSAQISLEERQLALDAGMDEVISKPVTRERLGAMIHCVLQGKATQSPGTYTPAPKEPDCQKLAAYRDQAGDRAAEMLCHRLLDHLPQNIAELRNAQRKRDRKAFAKALHQLEGSTALWADANTEELLDALRNSDIHSRQVLNLLTALEVGITQVLESIEEFRSQFSVETTGNVIQLSGRKT
ncbi:MAG: ATP-binding protein [Thiotrichales bacterium]